MPVAKYTSVFDIGTVASPGLSIGLYFESISLTLAAVCMEGEEGGEHGAWEAVVDSAACVQGAEQGSAGHGRRWSTAQLAYKRQCRRTKQGRERHCPVLRCSLPRHQPGHQQKKRFVTAKEELKIGHCIDSDASESFEYYWEGLN